MLLRWLRRRRAATPDATALYAAIVAQARQPVFHADVGVPDTLMGRYQVLALHVILLLDRLLDDGGDGGDGAVATDAATDAAAGAADAAAAGARAGDDDAAERREMARLLQERMFDDMDSALREIGVSDLAVPKRMRRLAELFYGQLNSYRAALRAADAGALRAALARNIFVDAPEAADAGAAVLAHYVLRLRRRLAATAMPDLRAGRIDWPPVLADAGNDGTGNG